MLDVDDLVFAVMQASRAPIQGRTKLQKLVFFVSEVLGIEAGYRPHFYGPYSSLVSATTESQVSRGALRETVEDFTGVPGFAGDDDEYRRYVYSLTDAGHRALAWRRQRSAAEFDRAVEVATKVLATRANYRVLSYAAKLYYILRAERAALTYGAAREGAKDLGWRMSPDDIDRGVELLLKMKLVSKRTPREQ